MDLDETLIYFPEEEIPNFHLNFKEKLKIRPFTQLFLKEMQKYFELVIFTASTKDYADPIINLMDVDKLIHHRLYREHLTNHHDIMVKDLTKLGRDLNHLIIIDNVP